MAQLVDSPSYYHQIKIKDSYSNLYLYLICLQLDKTPKTHLEVLNGMREAGILVNLHYIPVHL